MRTCLCHGFTTKMLISMHIHAFGSAPFLFAQTVITLTDNGFITELVAAQLICVFVFAYAKTGFLMARLI